METVGNDLSCSEADSQLKEKSFDAFSMTSNRVGSPSNWRESVAEVGCVTESCGSLEPKASTNDHKNIGLNVGAKRIQVLISQQRFVIFHENV